MMLWVMNTGKFQKGQDVQYFINMWEDVGARLSQEHHRPNEDRHSDQDDARRISGRDSSAG